MAVRITRYAKNMEDFKDSVFFYGCDARISYGSELKEIPMNLLKGPYTIIDLVNKVFII